MKFVLFCHAFTSCWNNGHAHFLRGIARELARLEHEVLVCEPQAGWSRANAIADGGQQALAEAEHLISGVSIQRYAADEMESGSGLEAALERADVVLVQEWNEPSLIAAIGRRRRTGNFRLFFLDAHHRAVTAPHSIAAFDLDEYDGVLAFGAALRDVYRARGWGRRAFTWHEAADTALFQPRGAEKTCDLVWIGNWGDEERSRELRGYLIEPSAHLGLRTRVHGVRYPASAQALLQDAGIEYAGWLPNHRVPQAFAGAQVTVHIPRQAYSDALVGIPTIRVFEALACGIPLVCSPWSDAERLFPPGCYLQVTDGAQMTAALRQVLAEPAMAAEMVRNGREAILRSHTCAHRVQELLSIVSSLSGSTARSTGRAEQPVVEAAP